MSRKLLIRASAVAIATAVALAGLIVRDLDVRDPNTALASSGGASSGGADRSSGVLSEITAPVSAGTVEIRVGARRVALGVAVSRDHIVTKSSAIPAAVDVISARGGRSSAVVVQRDAELDLALVRLSKDLSLTPVIFDERVRAKRGQLVACLGARSQTIGVGLATPLRATQLQPNAGFLGVETEFRNGGIHVRNAIAGGPAWEAGLRTGDRILAVGESDDATHEIESPRQFVHALHGIGAGGVAYLLVDRRGRELTVRPTLRPHPRDERSDDLFAGPQSPDASLWSATTFQHDVAVPPDACGGPVVSTGGNVIGLNMSRLDRVGTAVLDAPRIARCLARWHESGRLPDAPRPAEGDDLARSPRANATPR